MVTADQLRLFHNINNTLASIIGITANSFLTLLITKSKIPEIKDYGKILLQIVFFDIAYSIVCILVQPMTVIIEGSNYYVENGPFKHTSQPLNYIIFLVWFYLHFMNFFSVPIQFVYRYLVLCKSVKISNLKFLCFFIPPAVWVFCHTVFFGVTFRITGNDSAVATEVLKDWFLESGETDIHLTALGKAENFWAKMVSVEALCAMAITYGVIFFCMFKMHRFLKAESNNFSNKTKAMHKSFSRLLFIQGILPIFSSIGPTFFICYNNVIKTTVLEPVIFVLFFDTWVPVINAFSTLLIFQPFRLRMVQLLKTRDWKVLSSNVYRSTNGIQPSGLSRRLNQANIHNHLSVI